MQGWRSGDAEMEEQRCRDGGAEVEEQDAGTEEQRWRSRVQGWRIRDAGMEEQRWRSRDAWVKEQGGRNRGGGIQGWRNRDAEMEEQGAGMEEWLSGQPKGPLQEPSPV